MVDRHNDGLPMGIASLEDKFKDFDQGEEGRNQRHS